MLHDKFEKLTKKHLEDSIGEN